MLLPWRRKIEAWLKDKPENDFRVVWTAIKLTNRRISDMDEKLDAAMKKMDDVVAYAASVVDAVKVALEYLRAHQGDDKDAKEMADHVEAKMAELEAKLHEVGASGGTV